MATLIAYAIYALLLGSATVAAYIEIRDARISMRRVGGLVFWRVGRVGGSVYIRRN